MKPYSIISCAILCASVIAVTGCVPKQKIAFPQSGEMKVLGAVTEKPGAEDAASAALRHQKTGVVVESAVLCTGVTDRVPQGASSAFSASVGKVFCYTVVTGAARPVTLEHYWYWNGKEMARIPVEVNSARWRTYSSKKIDPSCTGTWTVTVVDAGGKELASVDFAVTDGPGAKR